MWLYYQLSVDLGKIDVVLGCDVWFCIPISIYVAVKIGKWVTVVHLIGDWY